MSGTHAGTYVGIGVREYGVSEADAMHEWLPYAVHDVECLRRALGGDFEGEPLFNPTGQAARDHLQKVKNSKNAGGPLILLWSGHAEQSASGLRLLTTDETSAGILITDVAEPLALSGHSQLLFIIDACNSGEAVIPATVVARAVMELRPPDAPHVWFGVLASCKAVEKARDGAFGKRLEHIIARGPNFDALDPLVADYLRMRWSEHNERVTGADVCDALVKSWDADFQTPDYLNGGSAWFMIRNPLFDAVAPEHVVEHLLRAARGAAQHDERSWFTGRTTQVNKVVEWVRSPVAGIRVVTGSAGTGKSAVVGRVVSLANTAERKRLFAEGFPLTHDDPGERSVAAHLHARGLTSDLMANLIDGDLTRVGILSAAPGGLRNASELVAAMQRAGPNTTNSRSGREPVIAPPVIIVDGLDEARGTSKPGEMASSLSPRNKARGEAFEIVDELLLPLAPFAEVIVAARELRDPGTGESLIKTLAPTGGPILDLDDPALEAHGRKDVYDYVIARLESVSPLMDPSAVAAYLTRGDRSEVARTFLVARIVTDQLRAEPVDTAQPQWERRVHASIAAAFNADVAQVDNPAHRTLPEHTHPKDFARRLLTALTWAYGAGFPEDEWITVANALDASLQIDRDDINWALHELGRYIVQDGEAGVAVYRVVHQSLADVLRPQFQASADQPFDPNAELVANALLHRYLEFLKGGLPSEELTYFSRHGMQHANAGGPNTLPTFESLTEIDERLRLNFALVAHSIAGFLSGFRNSGASLSALQIAVANYRKVVSEADPDQLLVFAYALFTLGPLLSLLGHTEQAPKPAGEAVAVFRKLAADEPDRMVDLARALDSFAIFLSEAGGTEDALEPAREAVTLYKRLVLDAPLLRKDLARAESQLAMCLANHGAKLERIGHYEEALKLTDEALTIFRGVATDDSADDLLKVGKVLVNLSVVLYSMGRKPEAFERASEAASILLGLSTEDTACSPDLAEALAFVGGKLSQMGHNEEALKLTAEAAVIYRRLAAENPSHLSDLAQALAFVGGTLSQMGRNEEALKFTAEAAVIYRRLAAENPSHLSDLAQALANLGGILALMHRYDRAVEPAAEALAILQTLTADEPAHLPNRDIAERNLNAIYRGLAQGNPPNDRRRRGRWRRHHNADGSP